MICGEYLILQIYIHVIHIETILLDLIRDSQLLYLLLNM